MTTMIERTSTPQPQTSPTPAPDTAPLPPTRRSRPRRRSTASRLLTSLRTATGIVLLVALLTALGALVVVPRVAGWVPLTVLSGSMEPTIPTGSQVVVEPVVGEADAAALQVGDVITVMPYPDDATLVTHRIVSRIDSADGVSFRTQGDANGAVDDWEITATQIRGEVKYWVPGAGYVATALDGHQKSVGIAALAAGLLGYAAVQVTQELRAKRRTRRG